MVAKEVVLSLLRIPISPSRQIDHFRRSFHPRDLKS
uniref:Uncharacterized protein n=1 Tax=Dulem virus 42 TaxID=3145760 RepID=A0AAU8B898_9CAUD